MNEFELLKLLKKKKNKNKNKKETKVKSKKLTIPLEEEIFIKKKKKLMMIYSSHTPTPVLSKGKSVKSVSTSQAFRMPSKATDTPLNVKSIGLGSSSRYHAQRSNFSSHGGSTCGSSTVADGSFSHTLKLGNRSNDFTAKNRQEKKEVNVIVKTNFVMAGRRQRDGSRATKEAVGSHASSALNYIENHGNRDLEQDDELSNVYDEVGERVSKEDFDELRKSFEKDEAISAMRRVVISPKEDLTRDEMRDLTIKTVQEFQEQTGKDLSFKFAIHTDTENIHSHIVITGSNADINFTKEQLGMFKDITQQTTAEIEKERKLEVSISKQLGVDRTLKKDTEQEL